MSERDKLVEALEEAQLEYDAVKYQHNHESSIALSCLEQAQERLDEFDGVTDSQRIKELESALRDFVKQLETFVSFSREYYTVHESKQILFKHAELIKKLEGEKCS